MSQFIYTNIGFEPHQYKELKYIAVEQGQDVAELLRTLVNQFVAQMKTKKREAPRKDFFFQLGASWKINKLKKAKGISEHDRVIYSL